MQEAEEQDTCRICSAPAEPDLPLFHPCKCSGTIRYIHQDCLTTWLAHSKKKTCDVCKHPYSFTKVYAQNMPNRLPPVLLIRRLGHQGIFAILFGLRAVAVAVIWLAVLPWATVWTWRMYFSMGDSTAWWVSDLPRPPANPEPPTVSSSVPDSELLLPSSENFVARVTTHPMWIALSTDIFTGQIIASLIVLTFVAVFLLREWISQNARPGVFEDEEILPDEPMPPPVIPLPQAPRLPVEQVDVQALGEQQRQAVRAVEAMRIREYRTDEVDQRRDTTPVRRRNIKGKSRQMAEEVDRSTYEPELPARSRRRLYTESYDEDLLRERARRRSNLRRPLSARSTSFKRRAQMSVASPVVPHAVPEEPVDTGRFRFTFRASPSSPFDDKTSRRSASEPISPPFLTSNPHVNEFSYPYTSPATPESRPADSNEPPRQFKFAFDGASFAQNFTTQDHLLPYSAESIRRPLLPVTTPRADADSPSPFSLSRPLTPQESPTIATYRAPEELQAGASGPSRPLPSLNEAEATDNAEKPWDAWEFEAGEEVGGGYDGPGGYENELPIEEIQAQYFRDPESDRTDDLGDEEDEEEDEDDPNRMQVPPVINHVGEVQPPPNPDVGVGQNNQNAPGEGGAPLLPGADIAGVAAVVENEEGEGNVEDDMEGAMEAIGMRGPIYGVFQNAALMIFVLDTALGIGIWIPFTIGKSTALLFLNPSRLFQILHLPIRAIRIITDPIVDSVVFVIGEFFVPPLSRMVALIGYVLASALTFTMRYVAGETKTEGAITLSKGLYDRAVAFQTEPLGQMFSWASLSSEPPATVDVTNASTTYLSRTLTDVVDVAEPYFAMLGKEVRLSSERMAEEWTQMALGHSPADRGLAVVLGYVVIGFGLLLYLNLLTVGNAKSAGRAVRSAIRQQLLVLKVAAFIFIELVTFPLGCGMVLDLCTVWLFPEANLMSRIVFFVQAPLTAMFYHWVAGTMFMYSFAILLSGCRSVMRPGAMWFIKDPQDQNSHPIRDILDRPTLTQLRKIFISGLMYSFVVACVVGSVAGLLLLGSKSIMPFRWKNREPLSNVPVDLLFLHLVLPYTMHYFRPKKTIKRLATVVWKVLAKKLRLTSYFFGGRHPQEEYTPSHWSFMRGAEEVVDEQERRFDGTFRRVPATENLALPRDMRATAQVTEDGQPFDDAARELMENQNAEAEKAKHHAKDDYMVVYIPPGFRYRVLGFIASLWVIGAVCLGVAVALPIQIGRSCFKLFTSRDMHDGYSLIIGFYLLWACYIIGKAIDRLDKRRQRTGLEGPRADLRVLVIKRGLLWVAKISYMMLFLGVVIPTLLACVMDLYIVLPIRLTIDPSLMPKIRMVDTWALGLLYAKIVLHVGRVQPPNQISRGIQRITNNGWTHPDPVMATKEVIGPIVLGLLAMIIIPGLGFRGLQSFLPSLSVDDKFIFMHVYPGIFMFAGIVRSATVLFDVLSSWSQSIRDKEFLVEMRLRNHEPEKVNFGGSEELKRPSSTSVTGFDEID